LSETAATTAIGVICKAPKPGASKTRLIPTLGAERAAALSRAFLIDLASVIVAVGEAHAARGYAVCSPASAAEDLAAFLPPSFGYLVETDAVLGGVLDRAAAALLAEGHASVILVNGDSPTLPGDILIQAITALRRPGAQIVFSPALDGGYTLIGLTLRAPQVFADIPWSTNRVLEVSRTRATEAGLRVEMIDPWYDIDDEGSLEWLRADLAGERLPGLTMRGAEAASTRKVLAVDA
jgi:rSAM/selenodomain-associated transferase 1